MTPDTTGNNLSQERPNFSSGKNGCLPLEKLHRSRNGRLALRLLQPVPAGGCLLWRRIQLKYNQPFIRRFYSWQITFRLSFIHFQSSYPMKNMLALASVFTVFMAVLLVWMDRALANHLEKRALHEMETTVPRTENKVPEIALPEVTIRAGRKKRATRQLPEVVIIARRCTGA